MIPCIDARSRCHGRNPAVDASLAVLGQCEAFLQGASVSEYRRACPQVAGSTIGQHVRHALDHFAAIVGSFEGGEIDYDHRDRGTPVEVDPAAARLARALGERLASVDQARLASAVRVRVMVDAEGHEAVFGSTFERELAFAAHHAVHHHAVIACIAGVFGIAVPPAFGRAPSTLHHDRWSAAQAADSVSS